MNFGNKLLLVFAVFASLMSYMVYRCFSIPVDLVSDQYYKDEIAYQDVIDGTKNANALFGKTSVKENPSDIVIQLPTEMKNHLVKGTVLFYCPSNMENDRHLDLATDADGKQAIDIKKFSKGSYTVKIDWKDGSTHFYTEKPLTIL